MAPNLGAILGGTTHFLTISEAVLALLSSSIQPAAFCKRLWWYCSMQNSPWAMTWKWLWVDINWTIVEQNQLELGNLYTRRTWFLHNHNRVQLSWESLFLPLTIRSTEPGSLLKTVPDLASESPFKLLLLIYSHDSYSTFFLQKDFFFLQAHHTLFLSQTLGLTITYRSCYFHSSLMESRNESRARKLCILIIFINIFYIHTYLYLYLSIVSSYLYWHLWF